MGHVRKWRACTLRRVAERYSEHTYPNVHTCAHAHAAQLTIEVTQAYHWVQGQRPSKAHKDHAGLEEVRRAPTALLEYLGQIGAALPFQDTQD